MIRHVILAIVGVAVLVALFSLPHKSFSLKNKILTTVLVLLLIVFAAIFESFSSNESSLRRDLLLKFEQGQDLKCANYTVNSKNFNYEYGTASFVAKDKSHGGDKALSGVSVDIKNCEAQGEK